MIEVRYVIIFLLLGLLTLLLFIFSFYYIRDLYRYRRYLGPGHVGVNLLIGFITDTLDVFGIGSFATTTMLLNATRQLRQDRLLPGTLNVAFTIPVILEAHIFIKHIEVEPLTLFSLIFAAVVGAVVGGRLVPKLSEQKVQLYLGLALLVTALLMFCKQAGLIEWLGTGNTAVGLTGGKLMLAIVLNGIFGALMTLGCGLYAPCMVMVFMLGLNPFVAFPIMMGSAAALMPVAGRAFIKAGSYERKISLCFTLSGIVAVLIATNFVLNMDVHLLAWGIIVVVLYTSISYVRKGLKKRVPAAEASGLVSKKAL